MGGIGACRWLPALLQRFGDRRCSQLLLQEVPLRLSCSPLCPAHSAAPLTPLHRWSLLAQAVLVGTTMPHARHVCGAAPLSHPAVHAALRRVYRSAQLVACLTPLPVSASLPDPPPEDQCTSLLHFFQLGLGLLLPVLWQTLSEARLFPQHQRERRAAGLPPERGLEAAVYSFVWKLTMDGMALQAALFAWMLLSTCWDQVSLLARSSHGAGSAPPL